MTKRPIEADYTSHVAYTRALEVYCDGLEQPAVEPEQRKAPCARECEAQAFKIEIRQLTRLVTDYMEIIAKQRVAMKEAHRVLGTLDVSITSRTLGARCGLADAMELGISAPQAQQPQLLTDEEIARCADSPFTWDNYRSIEQAVLRKNGVVE